MALRETSNMEHEPEQDLLADLTDAQREAVTHFHGPLLILAGAGSGKTRVITRRVAWLLQQGVHPGNILAITFTNKAAGEMRQRVEALVPGSRVWISTFHSFGARILRQYADRLGLDRSFTIYDQSDRARIVKIALEDADLDASRFTPETIAGAISKAKNQLLSPERYAAKAKDFYEHSVARVYPNYEKRLRDANALDFDDLLYWPALALRHDRELREELDTRFRFVLIDEYQDTNQAQYAIAHGLSQEYPNLCVVGDPDQCLPPGTLVETPSGPRPIETLQDGNRVISANGWGHTAAMWVDKVMANPYKGRLVNIHVEGGVVLRATPNHLCFGLLQPTPGTHFVYLMWKKGVGYRLGTTRGVRASKDGVIASGLQVRTNQEVADAIWVVRTCSSSGEARFYEHYLSVRYGIPTMVFFVRGRRMGISQEWVDQLYRDIDTESAATRLMADFYLDRRYPHHRPGGVTRGYWARRHVLFTLFGDHRKSEDQLWHHHRVQMVTTGDDQRAAAATRFTVRNGTKGTWRIETSRKHHANAFTLAQEIGTFHESDVVSRARLTARTTFPFMPAGHIQQGMLVPVLQDGQVVERRVERVEWEEYEGMVYDLSVPETHNFAANGLIVHNSIYRFRGSDIRNILDFERDFPNARVLTLSKNYRSTKAILGAAGHLIAHNTQRKPKDLVTDNPAGQPVTVLTFDNGTDEAAGIAVRIRDAVAAGKHRFSDVAIFVRINALTRGLETAFINQGIPHQIVKGLAFFERKENRDILAYLRLLVNPCDNISFLRIVNEPARGIGKVSLDHLRGYAEPREMSLLAAAGEVHRITAIKGKAAVGLRDFAQLMRDLGKFIDAAPDEVLRQVLDQSGYRRMLMDSTDSEDQDRLANIEELITAARQFAAEDPCRTIADFLENITLASDLDGWDPEQDKVSIMTLHASKGLEFPVVYMVALEQGLLPHERSLGHPEEVEEERRLAFVGMTRAKQELYLCNARMRDFRGNTMYTSPSMFLDELPQDAIVQIDLSASAAGTQSAMDFWRGGGKASEEGWTAAGVRPRPAPLPTRRADKDVSGYAAGMTVHHAEYGPGKIIEVSGVGAMRKVKIRFARAGERTFVADKVKLQILGNS
jgi:DNA helicase-2/ATP-dependent DNA helicase PcrA